MFLKAKQQKRGPFEGGASKYYFVAEDSEKARAIAEGYLKSLNQPCDGLIDVGDTREIKQTELELIEIERSR